MTAATTTATAVTRLDTQERRATETEVGGSSVGRTVRGGVVCVCVLSGGERVRCRRRRRRALRGRRRSCNAAISRHWRGDERRLIHERQLPLACLGVALRLGRARSPARRLRTPFRADGYTVCGGISRSTRAASGRPASDSRIRRVSPGSRSS